MNVCNCLDCHSTKIRYYRPQRVLYKKDACVWFAGMSHKAWNVFCLDLLLTSVLTFSLQGLSNCVMHDPSFLWLCVQLTIFCLKSFAMNLSPLPLPSPPSLPEGHLPFPPTHWPFFYHLEFRPSTHFWREVKIFKFWYISG